jgi:UDP-N-acetylmuramate: L-alanyl-gamma-D-glutamyl-meso-diaminopimelate ligase
VISEITDLHKIPENDRLDPDKLAADIARHGGLGRYIHSVDDIVATVVAEAQPGDVVAVLSNGGFGGIHAKLLERLG